MLFDWITQFDQKWVSVVVIFQKIQNLINYKIETLVIFFVTSANLNCNAFYRFLTTIFTIKILKFLQSQKHLHSAFSLVIRSLPIFKRNWGVNNIHMIFVMRWKFYFKIGFVAPIQYAISLNLHHIFQNNFYFCFAAWNLQNIRVQFWTYFFIFIPWFLFFCFFTYQFFLLFDKIIIRIFCINRQIICNYHTLWNPARHDICIR